MRSTPPEGNLRRARRDLNDLTKDQLVEVMAVASPEVCPAGQDGSLRPIRSAEYPKPPEAHHESDDLARGSSGWCGPGHGLQGSRSDGGERPEGEFLLQVLGPSMRLPGRKHRRRRDCVLGLELRRPGIQRAEPVVGRTIHRSIGPSISATSPIAVLPSGSTPRRRPRRCARGLRRP